VDTHSCGKATDATGLGAAYNRGVDPSTFDEAAFFRAVHDSHVRALLIGRRALVVLGLPLLTARLRLLDRDRRYRHVQ
jgi:hypothetical protein